MYFCHIQKKMVSKEQITTSKRLNKTEESKTLNWNLVVLGALAASVLAIGLKVRGFKPGRDDGF
jgi:hypothetical protein